MSNNIIYYVDCIIEIVKFYDILEICSQLLSGEKNNNIFIVLLV